MNAIRSLISICFISALALPAHAAGKLHIVSQRMDGDTRLYNVYCPDGSNGQVQAKYDLQVTKSPAPAMGPDGKITTKDTSTTATLREICTVKKDSDDVCRSNWTVDQAAQSLCR